MEIINLLIGVIIYILIKENFPFHWFHRKLDLKGVSDFEKTFGIQEDISGDILYFIEMEYKGSKYYKVGITRNSINERYSTKERKHFTRILYNKRIKNTLYIEQKILRVFKDDLFPLHILKSGYTEIFDKNILNITD